MALGIKINGHMQQGHDALAFAFTWQGKREHGWVSRSALDILPHEPLDSSEMIFEKNIERVEEVVSARLAEGKTNFDISSSDFM